MAAPVGVTSSAFTGACGQRHALEELGGRRRRDRHDAVGAFDRAAAGWDRAAGESVHAEQIERDGRPDDVGDAVERPDFVEVNLLYRMPMHRPLGDREPAENCQRQIALLVGQLSLIDDGFYVGQIAVRFFIGSFDIHISGDEAVALDLLDFQLDRQAKRVEPGANGFDIHPGVDQSGQRHVAAYAAEAIEMSHAHDEVPSSESYENQQVPPAGRDLASKPSGLGKALQVPPGRRDLLSDAAPILPANTYRRQVPLPAHTEKP